MKSSFYVEIEEINDFMIFCCSYRNHSFFMNTKVGNRINDITKETQWIGIKHSDNSFSVQFNIVDGVFRTSPFGSNNKICVNAITGDDTVVGDEKRYLLRWNV